MMTPKLLVSFLFCCFFLGCVGTFTASALPDCAPSSCGNLRNITHPFRLAVAQPETCGVPGFELFCEGNRTVWNIHSGRYYVTNISYENSTARLVDANLRSGNCSLPSQPLPPRSFYDIENRLDYPIDSQWVAFVNCSRKITNTMYRSLACMSRGNSTYVYVVQCGFFSACEVRALQPSCRFLSSIPLVNDANEALSSGTDVAEALQMGFVIVWSGRRRRASRALTIRVCLRYAFRLYFQDIRRQFFRRPHALEYNFYDCFQSNMVEELIAPRIAPRDNYGYIVIITIFLSLLHISIVFVLVGRFIVAPLSVLVLLVRKFREERASVDAVEKFLQRQEMLTPARYTYPEMIKITNHFEKKLGQGGFGSVFQGKLLGGYLVAVKMLSDSKCNGEEFINEVSTMGRIHHTNIMQLIGFCSDGANRALVYDYMPNGSLDRFIFPSNGASSSLCWGKLNEIALGIARGIEYLHKGCDMCILHFDIKPHNILLDSNFHPKVSDFGLAKLYPKEYSVVSMSAARGTVGYIAPELISRNFGAISSKSDVYSFGMLLLEMAGARKKTNSVAAMSSDAYFPTWIYDRLNEETVSEQQDGVAEIGEIERKLCTVGLWCIQMRPSARPSMSDVREMLEGNTFTLSMPPKPFFSSPALPSSVMRSCVDTTTTEELSVISEL